MKYRNVKKLLILLVLCAAGHKIFAQQYYIDLRVNFRRCGSPPCSGTAQFNGQQFNPGSTLSYTGQLTIPAAQPPTTYACGQAGTCGPPPCSTNSSASGPMPSPYNGTATMSGGLGSFTYCWEPLLGTTQATLSGNACGDVNAVVNLSQSTWAFSYQWQVSVDATNDWKDLGTTSDPGGAPLQSASWVVTQATLRGLFGELYGKNFFFRTVVNGCKSRNTAPSVGISFVAPKPVLALSSPTDVICNGQSNGTVVINIASTVIDRFAINLTNLDNGVRSVVPAAPVGNYTITGLGAGRWEFEVLNNNSVDRDKYGQCSEKIQHVVNQPTPVGVAFTPTLHNGYAVACNGTSTGEVQATGTGGVGNYRNFRWETGATTSLLAGVPADTYTVTLEDGNGCPATGDIRLDQPAPVQVTLAPSTGYLSGHPVSCWNKTDGGASSSVTGGITTQAYTYLWSTGTTGTTIAGRGTGTYSVTVTDANGCTDSENITLGAPLPINFTLDQSGTLACPSDATVSLAGISVVNTTGTVSYLWSSGESTAAVTSKGAGTYTLTVSDQQGCSTAKSVTINNPPAHTVAINALSNYNGSRITCAGESDGALEAVVKDPAGAITTAQHYRWTRNGTTIGDSPALRSLSDLGEGEYNVTITFGTGCEAENTFTLTDPDPVTATAAATTNYNGQPITCFNGTDANLRATAGGGTPGLYSYRWNTGATTALIQGVGAGTYTITVKDVNQCEGTATVTLNNPAPVEASILSVSDYSGYGISCSGLNDGAITTDASGGTGSYTYTWSDGKTTPAITGLAAGNYTLTLSDNNGCRDVITQTISSPTPVVLSIAREKNIACFNGTDGAIELLATGGVGGYQYSRDNGTSWQPSHTFNTLPQGTYTITLRDGNGCTKTVASTLSQPTQINIAFDDIQPAFCNNPAGTARAVVTGGVSGYTYRWQDADANVVDTDNVLSGVTGGIYTVIVRDANACERQNDVPISSTDGARSTYVATAAKCFDSADGSAAITITAGQGPFTTRWPDGQTTLQGLNLRKGIYNVLITDANNCTVVQTVDVPAPDAIALAIQTSVVPTCHGLCDGQMTLQATGGVGGYDYAWNGKTGATQTQLCAVAYPVTVTDANNCILHQDITLAQPEPLTLALAHATLATCQDGCDGALEALATGGNGDYQYTWAAGGNASIKTGLCPGTYRISVRDAKGCQGEAALVLNNTPALPLDLGGGITLCVGQSHTLDAGTSWTSIKWGSNTGVESTQPRITINQVGSYWVDVVSDKGCVAQDTFLLETSYDLLNASFLIPKEAVAGDTVVMIDISWPMPERVEWDYPLAMREVLNLGDVLFGQFDAAGTYDVGITARLGECVDQISKTIIILENGQESEGGKLGYEAFVKEFRVYPNPTDGVFDVGIELLEESHVMLSLWNAPTGILVSHVQHDGDKQYRIHFDLPSLTAGTYLLRLDHAKGKEYIRFIVYK